MPVNRVASREASPPREIWQSVPIECFVTAALVILAAGLKLCGVMP